MDNDEPKFVRIEYEVPPTRMIRSVWYNDFYACDDRQYKESFLKQHPDAKIRKFERGIDKEGTIQ